MGIIRHYSISSSSIIISRNFNLPSHEITSKNKKRTFAHSKNKLTIKSIQTKNSRIKNVDKQNWAIEKTRGRKFPVLMR